MGTQNGKVGIVGLQILVGMSVHHRQTAVVIFLTDKAARILTEGAHLVLERSGIADQLGLVEHLIDLFHDLVSHLHTHADVDGSRLVGNVVFCAYVLQPVSSPPAGRHHDMLRLVEGLLFLCVLRNHTLADAVLDHQIFAAMPEQHIHALLLQIFFNRQIKLLRLLRSQMPDWAVHQLKSRLNGALSDILHLVGIRHALHMGVSPELQINLIRVVDELLREFLPHQSREVAAHLVA